MFGEMLVVSIGERMFFWTRKGDDSQAFLDDLSDPDLDSSDLVSSDLEFSDLDFDDPEAPLGYLPPWFLVSNGEPWRFEALCRMGAPYPGNPYPGAA